MIRHAHFIWGGPEIPERYRANLRAFSDLHDDWDVTLWSDEDLRWLDHRDLFDDAAYHVPADAIWQFRSDIARYEILLKYGGLYMDTDVTVLRNIEPALEGHDAFAVAETPRWTGNTILYTDRPHHPVIEHIVADLRTNIQIHEPRRLNRPNVLTGPKFVTERWRSHECYEAPTKLFFPLSFTDALNGREVDLASLPPETFTYHEFGHVRSLKGTADGNRTRRPAWPDRQRGR